MLRFGKKNKEITAYARFLAEEFFSNLPPNLIEKQRSSFCEFKLAHMRRLSIGKRTFFVAKQFALQKRGVQGGTVQLNERAPAAVTEIVGGAVHHVFTVSSFPG